MATESDRDQTVVLVLGIGFGGSEMSLLAQRLRHRFSVKQYYHRPRYVSLTDNAEALLAWMTPHRFSCPHFVMHSLGGPVVLRMLELHPELSIGRLVFLGSPLCGCLAARTTLRVPGGKVIVGNALATVCETPPIPLPPGCEAGAIAGTLNFIVGLFLCPGEANDTLVCVRETKHPDLKAHCVLAVSHSSMLLSGQVSKRVECFLRSGTF